MALYLHITVIKFCFMFFLGGSGRVGGYWDHTWLCLGLLLVVLSDQHSMLGSNLGWLSARQAPYPCTISLTVFFFSAWDYIHIIYLYLNMDAWVCVCFVSWPHRAVLRDYSFCAQRSLLRTRMTLRVPGIESRSTMYKAVCLWALVISS